MSKRQLLQLELILSPWVCVLWSRKKIKLSEESLEGNIYCFPSFSSSVASSFSFFKFYFQREDGAGPLPLLTEAELQ